MPRTAASTLRSLIAAEVAKAIAQGQSTVKVAAVAERPKTVKATAPKVTNLKLKFVARPGKVTNLDKFEIDMDGAYGTIYLPKGTDLAAVRLSR